MGPPVESILGSNELARSESMTMPAITRTGLQSTIERQSAPERVVDQGGWPRISSISVVVPMFNEEGNLPELHHRLTSVLTSLGLPYEFIFIDDGSNDGTWSIVRDLRSNDSHVVALRHRRNFGKAQALANGFAIAKGEAIITMDGDLQDDPDELPRFIDELNDGNDLVSGWKQRRQDPLGKTAPSRVFNWAVRRASGVQLHDFNCGFKGYRNEVTKTIRLYGELHRFTPVLANAEGFRIHELPVKHHPRTWGKSKYGWSRLVKGFLDLLTVSFITNYRQRPMHLFGLPGLFSLMLGVIVGLYLTFERIFQHAVIGTRPLLSLAILLVVIGAQFFGLGLLGEFLAHGSNAPKNEVTRSLRETIGVTDEPLRDAGMA
jgi:glycosyltransferase involved in cell wall biosynthesis